jgi:hypothetical protein
VTEQGVTEQGVTEQEVKTAGSSARRSTILAVIVVFSALIAVGTILSIPLPPPLYELTWSPAIYMALALMVDQWTAASATGMGSFIGEAFNVAYKGGGSPIYPFGMIWARAPEALIIGWARTKSQKMVVLAMVGATVFETLAFFFPDWLFYNYALFQYQPQGGIWPSFATASYDFGTLADLAYIPVALLLAKAAKPAFRRLGFG